MLDRVRRFVEEGLAAAVHGHVHKRSHPEAEKDALLDPAVDAPPASGRSVRLSGADQTAVQRVLELLEEAEVILGVRLGLVVEKSFDLS